MVRVKNVYLPVADMAAAVRFYESLLGLAPQVVDGERWAQFKVQGVTFALGGMGETPEGVDAGGVVTFEVEDLCGAVERLRSCGVTVSPVRDMGDHGRTCWFRDPFGNPVQLYAR
ncbi:VOC family protein [Alicyclobacillus kakegawensis]|uniref:VOC family protein n=1 Tax=Alicyclobacillus kakegawensis TaxID=392012 RepID=UPI00082F2E1D|nr:VOC family protein [Alicyclobacillus kakegawensis]